MSELKAGDKVGGRYVLVRLLNRGALAETWSAADASVVQPWHVALKIGLEKGTEPLPGAAILRELTHPGIIELLDEGIYDGRTFYVMPWMSGGSLDERISAGTLTFEDILALAKDVCPALDYCHARGVIHQDIKPANVLRDGDGRWRLSDFDIARDIDKTLAPREQRPLQYTQSYSAPEQVSGELTDASTDVCCLGVTLARALTGILPTMNPVSGARFVDLRWAASTPLNQAVGYVLNTAMAPPGARTESAGALLAGLLDASDPLNQPQPEAAIIRWHLERRNGVLGIVLECDSDVPFPTIEVHFGLRYRFPTDGRTPAYRYTNDYQRSRQDARAIVPDVKRGKFARVAVQGIDRNVFSFMPWTREVP